MQRLAKARSIKVLFGNFPHYHCHLIDRLIGNQQFAVAVIDESARRIECLFQLSIIFCFSLSRLVNDL